MPCGNPQLLKLTNQNKPRGNNPCTNKLSNGRLPRHHLHPKKRNPNFPQTLAATMTLHGSRRRFRPPPATSTCTSHFPSPPSRQKTPISPATTNPQRILHASRTTCTIGTYTRELTIVDPDSREQPPPHHYTSHRAITATTPESTNHDSTAAALRSRILPPSSS